MGLFRKFFQRGSLEIALTFIPAHPCPVFMFFGRCFFFSRCIFSFSHYFMVILETWGGWNDFYLNPGQRRWGNGTHTLHRLSYICPTVPCLWGDTGPGLTVQTWTAPCVRRARKEKKKKQPSFFNNYEPAQRNDTFDGSSLKINVLCLMAL